MSEYMQIDIRLLPFYGSDGFRKQFPNLAGFLKNFGYTRVLEEEPSLYQLVEVLTRIRSDPAISENAKQAVTRMEPQFKKIRDQAREHLLARRLNELDRTLYQLEDQFKELEREIA